MYKRTAAACCLLMALSLAGTITITHPLCYAVSHGHSHHVRVVCANTPPHLQVR